MERLSNFDFFEGSLSYLAFRINNRGRLNLLDINLHSETFYQHLCNLLFGWNLKNLNSEKPNAEAIDLIDEKNKILIQVSSTVSREKIQSTLDKDLTKLRGYNLKFISISKDAENLRKLTYNIPNGILFNTREDIIDIPSILRKFRDLEIDDQKKICDFVKKELDIKNDPQRLESNLANIINLLSKEDFDNQEPMREENVFEIERKIDFNNLVVSRTIIEDYKINHGQVDRIYSEFDAMGVNKSRSVLASIRKVYLENINISSDDDLFNKVIDDVKNRILLSPNFDPIPYEELELCTNILVVDAFIRCKIFENPEGYEIVNS